MTDSLPKLEENDAEVKLKVYNIISNVESSIKVFRSFLYLASGKEMVGLY